MADLFTRKSKRGGHERERLIDIAREQEEAKTKEAPVVVTQIEEPPAPPSIETYLDPDVEHGRPRIIVMLSEDGQRIEPILMVRMSHAMAASNLVRAAVMQVDPVLERLVQLEKERESLNAEMDFLYKQIARNVSPPPPQVVPRPFADVPKEIGRD